MFHYVQQGGLSTLLLHGEHCLGGQQDGLVNRLIHVVPRHSVHLHVGLVHDPSLPLLLVSLLVSEHS